MEKQVEEIIKKAKSRIEAKHPTVKLGYWFIPQAEDYFVDVALISADCKMMSICSFGFDTFRSLTVLEKAVQGFNILPILELEDYLVGILEWHAVVKFINAK